MWYYLDNEQSRGPFSEDKILTLITDKIINENSLVWREGQGEWAKAGETELATLFKLSAQQHPQPTTTNTGYAPQPAMTGQYYYRDTSSLTLWVRLFLILDLIVTFIISIVATSFVNEIGVGGFDPNDFDISSEFFAQFMAFAGVGAIGSIISITTVVLFLVWCNWSCKNVHSFGAQRLSFTPGWAVGWWFIPIAHLFMPYLVMKEIFKASKNPAGWEGEECDLVLHLWWFSWIMTSIVGLFIGCYSVFNPESLIVASALSNGTSLALQFAAGIAAIMMVGRISQLQAASQQQVQQSR